jgi:hypothetical protein
LCGPWQHQPPKSPSKRPIGTDGIVGTDTIIGTDIIIGIVAIIGIDTIIGVPITGAITGIPIIGDTPGRRGNLTNTAIERPPRAGGFSILTGTPRESMFGKLVAELL